MNCGLIAKYCVCRDTAETKNSLIKLLLCYDCVRVICIWKIQKIFVWCRLKGKENISAIALFVEYIVLCDFKCFDIQVPTTINFIFIQ